MSKVSELDLDAMLVYAARYAIGRHTYASVDMAEMVVKYLDQLSPQATHTIHRDITVAFEQHEVDELSTEPWREALLQLSQRLPGTVIQPGRSQNATGDPKRKANT